MNKLNISAEALELIKKQTPEITVRMQVCGG